MGMFLRRGVVRKGTPIGNLPVGTAIKLNVDGTPWEFLIVQQGLPGDIYDESCDGAWLLMKDLYEKRVWNDPNLNRYKTSAINAYLNGTFLGLLDDAIKSIIKQVKIPYGSGAANQIGINGLACKVFLLGGYEVGFPSGGSLPVDGAKLSYFDAGTGADANNKRIASLNGAVEIWWLRSPSIGDSTGYVYRVTTSGGSSVVLTSFSQGIRPAFILPTEFLITSDMLA